MSCSFGELNVFEPWTLALLALATLAGLLSVGALAFRAIQLRRFQAGLSSENIVAPKRKNDTPKLLRIQILDPQGRHVEMSVSGVDIETLTERVRRDLDDLTHADSSSPAP